MGDLSAASPAPAALDQPARPRAALPALCLTQITSWGVVYYAFPVLNPQITDATGWSPAKTTAAFSAALLVSALAGIRIGRVLDTRGPRAVMTTGSVIGVASLIVIATAPNLLLFTTGWLLAGLSMASTFYQPAFAALTRWWAPDHVRALTVVTLAGGLASTVFAPLTAQLSGHFGWRHTYLILAVALAALTVPAHAFALRGPWPPAPVPPASGADTGAASLARSRPFLLLAVALTLSAFAMYAVVVTLVPLLLDRGYTATQAAWALGLGGAGQTLGRTLYAALARRTSPALRATVLIGLGGTATGAFALFPGPYPLLALLAVVAGTIRGNLTLLQATAITDRWGTRHYGRLSGVLAAPTTTASALAPFAGTALAVPLGGYPQLFAVLALASAAAALVAWRTTPTDRMA
ncbi:integral membrane transport protein [Streptomyces albus]|uniref:Integral membrane transport protein n=1 Tax=Streptomyces albus (strain ATCC 21838 / DSM 41398 / FERM P-419 / JCM 4703 / NBRC 107858) TaxID=1081613 RepID=A0A0B5EWM5_STRA4|nr:integral membrane transport protein [Streptomyces albus]AOU77922.1 integral membrane transport protein [Streptomyces albus]AYN33677.1 MFS transporter [Streptomyces albus]